MFGTARRSNVAAAAARFVLPETHGPGRSLDLPALVLVAVATTALVYALVRAADAGWSARGTVVGLVIGALALVRER